MRGQRVWAALQWSTHWDVLRPMQPLHLSLEGMAASSDVLSCTHPNSMHQNSIHQNSIHANSIHPNSIHPYSIHPNANHLDSIHLQSNRTQSIRFNLNSINPNAIMHAESCKALCQSFPPRFCSAALAKAEFPHCGNGSSLRLQQPCRVKEGAECTRRAAKLCVKQLSCMSLFCGSCLR